MKDEFAAEDFCTVVFDEFFFTSISNDNFARHLLRLLWVVYPKISSTRIENLMKLTEPTSGLPNDPIQKIHSELLEKIATHQTAVEAMKTDEEKGDSLI